jgi:hypothetical protein
MCGGDFWKNHRDQNNYNFFKEAVYKHKKKSLMHYYLSEKGRVPHGACPTGTGLQGYIDRNPFALEKRGKRHKKNDDEATANADLDNFVLGGTAPDADVTTSDPTLAAIDQESTPPPLIATKGATVITETPAPTMGKRSCWDDVNDLEVPVKKKLFQENVYTPVTSACLALDGKRSQQELIDKLLENDGRATIEWCADSEQSEPWTVNRRVFATARILNTLCQKDSRDAAQVLDKLLSGDSRKTNMQPVLDSLISSRPSGSTIDEAIVNGMASFVGHHTLGRGSRKKLTQDAMEAVTPAAAFNMKEMQAASSIANRLGLRQSCFAVAVERVKQMKTDSTMFSPKVRKIRSDSTKDVVMTCIVEWCHEFGSRIDTNSCKVYKVKNYETGAEELHPLRVWNEVTWVSRHKAFHSFETYSEFCDANPGVTIGRGRFRRMACRCIKKPTPQSCVDILVSGAQEYMHALQYCFSNNIATRVLLRECKCELHTEAANETATVNYERNDSERQACRPLENVLKGKIRVDELIDYLCCPAVTEPTLAYDPSRNPPKQIPWECTHGKGDTICNDCGVEKILGLSKCPVYSVLLYKYK